MHDGVGCPKDGTKVDDDGGLGCPNDGTKVDDDWELVVPKMGQKWMMIGSWLSQ